MGTFHQDKGPLHGITVVVDTHGPTVFVGRCDDMDDQGIVLLDADLHEETAAGRSKQEYLRRAAAMGIWPCHERVFVPKSAIASVRRLADL